MAVRTQREEPSILRFRMSDQFVQQVTYTTAELRAVVPQEVVMADD
jgi:hypothetical protein